MAKRSPVVATFCVSCGAAMHIINLHENGSLDFGQHCRETGGRPYLSDDEISARDGLTALANLDTPWMQQRSSYTWGCCEFLRQWRDPEARQMLNNPAHPAAPFLDRIKLVRKQREVRRKRREVA